MAGTGLRVETVDGEHTLFAGETFTFGRSRSCTFCVDDSDRNISRRAGSITFDGSRWRLTNTSTQRILHVMDDLFGVRHKLLPGRSHLIDERSLTVLLPGSGRSQFEFRILNELVDAPAPEVASIGPFPTLEPPPLSPVQRKDLAVLFYEFHAPEVGREPQPRSYAEAATQLGCTPKALERRVWELRQKLRQRGYSNMGGSDLASFLICTGALQPRDFEAVAPASGMGAGGKS